MPLNTSGKVLNHDIRGIHTRINRFIIEVALASSANLANVNGFDQARLAKYLQAIRTYHDWIVAQPALDLPETAPREYPLDGNPAIGVVENEAVRDVIVMLELVRDEVVSSQSARMPCGILSFDSSRLLAVIDKVQAFLDNYIAIIQPLDLPESSPMRQISPGGSTGI